MGGNQSSESVGNIIEVANFDFREENTCENSCWQKKEQQEQEAEWKQKQEELENNWTKEEVELPLCPLRLKCLMLMLPQNQGSETVGYITEVADFDFRYKT